MATCQNCSARLVPAQTACAGCGRSVADARRGGSEVADPMLGRTIAGNYEIHALLGKGAMGRVYRALQISLDKPIAIKVLHGHLVADPAVAKRFHREARAASRLSHPNSLHIIDFGEDEDGTLYIAMELLDGDDLLTVIDHDAPLTPERIARLLRQVLSALDTAHHSGIIHRDLKPENVVVLETPSGDEHVKVCDFGIAKIQEAEGGSAITVSGFVCGTPEYMAPEQARGEQLDARADIYAAGCMLYQMLTGTTPFTAESALGIITKHLTEVAVPPRERKPEWHIPQALEDVVLRAMAKDRDARYPDAASMSRALESAVASLGPAAKERLGSPAAVPPARESGTAGQRRSLRRAAGWTVALVALGAAVTAVALLTEPGGGEKGSSGAVAVPVGPSETPEETDSEGLVDGAGADVGVAGGRAAVNIRGADGGRGTAPLAEGSQDQPAPAAPDGRSAKQPPTGRLHRSERGATPQQAPSPGELAYERGRGLFLSNDIDGAIESFEEAARLMPQNPQVHKQLGRAHMRAGAVDRAAAAYRRYLDLAPNAPDRTIVERIIQSRTGG